MFRWEKENHGELKTQWGLVGLAFFWFAVQILRGLK